MSQWLCDRKATSTIFNLKLPMKQRFQIVAGLIANIANTLNERQIKHQLRAKHLYHDRDEITVMILTGAHLLE